jgi:hypothetical protein
VTTAPSNPITKRRAASAAARALFLAATALMASGCTKEQQTKAFKVADDSFRCITEMTPVRHFFVDNLAGNLAETVKIATAGKGEYPVGSVVQLIPNEVMVKMPKGTNVATKDWEFIWLDVDKNGQKIGIRGFQDANNRFGMNCFGCHVKAKPEFDLICETTNGCDAIPLTKPMFGALQRTDPRCKGSDKVSKEDQESLALVETAVKALTANLPKK